MRKGDDANCQITSKMYVSINKYINEWSIICICNQILYRWPQLEGILRLVGHMVSIDSVLAKLLGAKPLPETILTYCLLHHPSKTYFPGVRIDI